MDVQAAPALPGRRGFSLMVPRAVEGEYGVGAKVPSAEGIQEMASDDEGKRGRVGACQADPGRAQDSCLT
jgi:hypothetical protein